MSDPESKSRSVILTDMSKFQTEASFRRLFGCGD